MFLLQASFSHPSFNVSVRWAAFCPLSHLHQDHINLELLGGPGLNPDSLLVFQSDVTSGAESLELSRLSGGTLSFSMRASPGVSRRASQGVSEGQSRGE